MKNTQSALSDSEFNHKNEVLAKVLQFIIDSVNQKFLDLPLEIAFQNEAIGKILTEQQKISIVKSLMLIVAGKVHEIGQEFLDFSDEVLQIPRDPNSEVRKKFAEPLDHVFDIMNIMKKIEEGTPLTETEKELHDKMMNKE